METDHKAKRNVRRMFWAKMLLGLAILVGLLFSVDIGQFIATIKDVRAQWIPVFICLALGIYWYHGFLLGLVVAPFARIPQLRLFAFTMIGRFFSLFIPSMGGDLLKGMYLFPYCSNPGEVYAAMVLLRMLSGLSTLVVAVVAGAVLLPETFRSAALVAFMVLVCGIVVGAVGWWMLNGRVKAHLLRAREKRTSTIVKMLYSLGLAVTAYRENLRVVVVTFFLTVLTSFLSAFSYWFVAFMLKVPLDFTQALMAASATMLCVLIPITPGGVGVGESAFVIVGEIMGVPREDGLAIALVARLFVYVCSLPGGIVYLLMPLPVGKSSRGVDSSRPAGSSN